MSVEKKNGKKRKIPLRRIPLHWQFYLLPTLEQNPGFAPLKILKNCKSKKVLWSKLEMQIYVFQIPWALWQDLDSNGMPIFSGSFKMHLMLILTFSFEFWRVDRGKPMFILFPASHFFHSLHAKFKDTPTHGPKKITKEVTKRATICQQQFYWLRTMV